MLPPSPPRTLRFFGDFPPKNPRNFGCPRPRSVPEPVGKCIPVPIPEFRGFSGTGKTFPRSFQLSPSPNFPRTSFRGNPRGSPGIPEVQGDVYTFKILYRGSPNSAVSIYADFEQCGFLEGFNSPNSAGNPQITRIFLHFSDPFIFKFYIPYPKATIFY